MGENRESPRFDDTGNVDRPEERQRCGDNRCGGLSYRYIDPCDPQRGAARTAHIYRLGIQVKSHRLMSWSTGTLSCSGLVITTDFDI